MMWLLEFLVIVDGIFAVIAGIWMVMAVLYLAQRIHQNNREFERLYPRPYKQRR